MKNLKLNKNVAYNEKSVRVYFKKQLRSGATHKMDPICKLHNLAYYALLAKPRTNYPCITSTAI